MNTKCVGGKMQNNSFFKSMISMVAAATLFISLSAKADSPLPATKDVYIGINDAYVPGGFDSEADSFVVVSGIFPNGCYKWKEGQVTNLDPKTHEIRSLATVSQGMCLMVLIPFSKEIRLGKLETGIHTLRFMNGDGTYLEKSLKIE